MSISGSPVSPNTSGSTRVSVTSAMPVGLRSRVPAKMTSCMLTPRRERADCSPSTHEMASEMFDLPQPFGPTMAATPSPWNFSSVRSQNDLNPRICSFFSLSNLHSFSRGTLHPVRRTLPWMGAAASASSSVQLYLRSPQASTYKTPYFVCIRQKPHPIASVLQQRTDRGSNSGKEDAVPRTGANTPWRGKEPQEQEQCRRRGGTIQVEIAQGYSNDKRGRSAVGARGVTRTEAESRVIALQPGRLFCRL